MAVTKLLNGNRACSVLSFIHFNSKYFSSIPHPNHINDICRILSDNRSPRHDLELALTPFSSHISTDLVNQVLKRTTHLGFSAHRFFLWAQNSSGYKPNLSTYNILINVLGKTKQFPLMWEVLHEIKHREDIEITRDVFWDIFGLYCRAKIPHDAIRAYNRMVEFGLNPSLNDLECLLYLLCKRGFVSDGQEFFDKVKLKYDVGVKIYSILVKGWGDIGDSGNARKVFDEMLQRGCKVDVAAFNSLIDALCNGGEFDEAYGVFRGMVCKGVVPNAYSYSIFIRSYCKRGDVHSIFRVLDRMKRYNLVPNVFTYNCIVKKLCDIEKVDDAYGLLDEMVEMGVDRDIWSYNRILAYHCERFEVNRAIKVLSRMKKENCKPDRHTYNMLLKMLIRIGRFDRVEEVWDSLAERGFYPSVSTYAVMIHGFLKKKGKVEEACKYFEIMIDEGIPPYTSTIDALRNRLVGLGFLDRIDILVEKMESSSSSAIKELSETMRGHRSNRRREKECSEFSEDEWPFSPDMA